ncbi:FAD:protein FMN transferase [Tritonibacter litoralis]|nr:FAD:protein FMN transferase [Tritonibacter litoralis]
MISRRRFLSLSAASMATPAWATPTRWHGFALGAEVTLTIHADPDQAAAAISVAKSTLAEGEALFSLYNPQSDLTRLNRTTQLHQPDPLFLHMLDIADHVHGATDGCFDPTVQPLWQALAQGANLTAAQAALGWHRIRWSAEHITLEPGQALTLNGIAQGVLTDVLRDRWRAMGLDHCLINLGEFAALGGPFNLGVVDARFGQVAVETLQNAAIATSSPAALPLGRDHSHILGPNGQLPKWATVSVTAQDAGLADAASTAFCLMSQDEIRTACRAMPGVTSVLLVSETGALQRLTPSA